MQAPRLEDLINQGSAIPNRQLRPSVVDLTGTDIEQRMGMRHRDFGLLLDIPMKASGPQDQQSPVLLEPNPGGAVPLLREEALDLAQATSLPLNEAGQGGGKEKAAANGHETLRSRAMKPASDPVQATRRLKQARASA